MTLDPDHVQRLRALSLWLGPIVVKRLPGGITNENYLVRDGRRTLAARFREERPDLGIDRRNEVVCQRAAHALGVAPEVVLSEDGILLSQYIAGRTASLEDTREPAFIARLAAVLRALHRPKAGLLDEAHDFSAFDAVRTYAASAARSNARLPNDIDALVEASTALEREIRPCTSALCHNDLLAGNIIDDDDRIWLVDWEYAGMGNPLFDLASISANCYYDDSMEIELLRHYRGSVDEPDLRELHILKSISLIREALWAVIQTVASRIDFDYSRLAADSFAAYRQARAALGPLL
jgi:thiamine kinase-like enzyme